MKAIACLVLSALAAVAQVRLPPYTRHLLPNGAILVLMQRTEVPLVTVKVTFKGGFEAEPAELPGVANLVAEGIRHGTAKRSNEQFSNELDSLGATFNSAADLQSMRVTAEFLSKDLAAGLDLILDAILHPAFQESEMQKVVAQYVDIAKGLKDNPDAAAWEYYRSFYFGAAHPYGRPADELTYSRISRKNVVDFHKRMFVGRNMIVAIAGDFDARTAVRTLSAAFGAVPSGEAYAWKHPPSTQAKQTRIAVVDKPDATQTEFLIGQPGIERNNPDRVPLWVANTIFGGRFTSILNDELRVNSGLTYGASSRLEQTHLPGRITITSFTRTETTGKAVDIALMLLRRLREKGVTADQLSSAKEYLKGTYPADHLETSDQLVDVLSEIELYDLNRGEVDDLFSRIDAVTLEGVNAVIKRYYGSDNLTFLLLGNSAKFVADLKKYGGDVVKVPISRPGLHVSSE